ncbi:hypothetical protein PCASD_01786 [Puccinia coronata f. sp. avenae]|uniref:Uncharacterized protein n=1 Tax=Puccinia coronata f. sp. avenae TaxID=200324 RepID=A0A2N5VJM9_9BASI|nr:hypothetical protein PCASD_01786 [Puccinia coronata f. sp. avenae]
MSAYIADLRRHINVFVYLLIKSNTQWINKPKIHMLLHLPDLIEHFGPAALFLTKTFESYNGVLQQASVHSNRQSPGRDLAVTFDNYAALKFLVSGGVIHNEATGGAATASDKVQNVFSSNPQLQQAMGYNHLTAQPVLCKKYPLPLTRTQREADKQAPPPDLLANGLNCSTYQVARLMLRKNVVGKVQSLNSSVAIVHTLKVLGTINVQHNCHQHQCPVVASGPTQVEHQDTGPTIPTVRHSEGDHMIINSASLSNAELHWVISDLPMHTIGPHNWIRCVKEGYDIWAKIPDDVFDTEEEDEENLKEKVLS